MMTHRRSTHPPASESSVAWYKIIAISFLVLTLVLLALVLYMTTKRATITILAKEDTQEVTMAVTVGATPGPNTIVGKATSTVFLWSKDYFPGATESIEGVSKGTVMIYNKTDKPMALVKTTRLLSDSGVLFRLSTYIAVPAKGQISAEVYADKSGKESDIQPSHFTIPGLTPDLQSSIYAESGQAMSGGNTMIGVVTQEDINTAEADFKDKVKNAFLSTYTSSSPSGQHILATVVESTVEANQKPGAKVKMFTLTGTSTLAVVSFSDAELNQLVSQTVGQKIDTKVEKLLSADATPTVTLNAVTLVNGTAELKVAQTVVATLNEESSQVKDRTNYTDKTKDQIIQYVKSLPHAIDAEVTFSPSWLMHSSPSIPGKITLTGVKIVQ